MFDNGEAAGAQLLNDTMIIRLWDQGEMGLSHGGLRQKAFVAYEEALRVPMVWSNPQMYPTTQSTTAMVSHVDFLPTLCDLAGVPNWQSQGFMGVSYASIVINHALFRKLITTIAAVHSAHFGSLRQIADAKAEVFAGMTADGVAVLNRDNEFYDHLAASAVSQACLPHS